MTGAGALAALGAPALAHAQTAVPRTTVSHFHVPANADTVHWGYFSKKLKPVVEVDSGDFVTLETVTHHAYDDYERMIKGDPGVESIFYWDKKKKGVNRRGAGPDGRLAVRARRGRGPRRARLHRPGGRQRRGARRHPRGAHPRRDAAPLRQSEVPGQGLRQQRRGLVGLSLQRHDRGAQEARGDHDLRGRRDAASATGPRRSTTSAGRRRPIRSAWCTRPSTTPACRSTTARSRRTGACSRTCASRSGRTSA